MLLRILTWQNIPGAASRPPKGHFGQSWFPKTALPTAAAAVGNGVTQHAQQLLAPAAVGIGVQMRLTEKDTTYLKYSILTEVRSPLFRRQHT
jgi:hypothetical protein